MNEKSNADLLREEIKQAISSNYDFRLASNRTNFLNDFAKKHATLGVSVKGLRPSFNRILEKELPSEQKIEKKTRKPHFNSDLAANLSEKPSGIKTEDTKKPSGQPELKTVPQVDKDGKPLPGQPAPIIHEHLDADSVGATLQALLIPIKAANIFFKYFIIAISTHY